MTNYRFDSDRPDPQEDTPEVFEAARLVTRVRQAMITDAPGLEWDAYTRAALAAVARVLHDMADAANERDQDSVSVYQMVRQAKLIRTELEKRK